MIEMIEMIEMFSAPLAGDTLHRGLRRGVELVIFGIWVFATLVVGMGFAYGLGRFLKKCNPCFADPSPFVYIFLKFQGEAWKLMDSQVRRIRVSPMVCPSRQFRRTPPFQKTAGD